MTANADRSSSRTLLIVLGVALAALSAVFGVRTLQQQAQFRAYRAQTAGADQMPWETEPVDVAACIEHTVSWGVACTGMESWCLNEAPRRTMACMASQDRAVYCQEQGDAVLQTSFGYAKCQQLRESVSGKYAKRTHKKYCAAVMRAVAEHCRTRS